MVQATPFRCLLVAGLLALATSTVSSQPSSSKTTKTTPSATSDKPDAPEKAAVKKFRGRLPNNYGKLGLTATQRESIYAIQEKNHAAIEELEAQLAALKIQQVQDIEAVLTDEQKTALAGLKDKTKSVAKKADAGS